MKLVWIISSGGAKAQGASAYIKAHVQSTPLLVVKNPPANAAGTGSIPGPGRSHMPRSS